MSGEAEAQKQKPTVLWLDGCFDGFHYAHANINAVRQCLTIVDGPVEIIVGVHSDSEITKNKGPPLFDEQERYALIAGCRWVSRVVEDVPYVTQLDVFEQCGVDFIVHGDDPVTDADGNDCYAIPKAMGRYKECKRTEGISTTSLIQRVLSPNLLASLSESIDQRPLRNLLHKFVDSCSPPLPILDVLNNFSLNKESWNALYSNKNRSAIGYIANSWDCFCASHVSMMNKARRTVAEATGQEPEQVTLIVGIWNDEDAEKAAKEKPLLLMYERALATAQCRYTNAILLNAPRAHGDFRLQSMLPPEAIILILPEEDLPVLASAEGATKYIQLSPTIKERLYTVETLRSRVLRSRDAYMERQRRKGCS